MERFLLIEYIVFFYYNYSFVECFLKEISYYNSKVYCKLCFGFSCCLYKNVILWRGLNWRMAYFKLARYIEYFGKFF